MRGVRHRRRPSVAPRARRRTTKIAPKRDEGCGCEATLELLAARGGPHARSVLASHQTDVRFFTVRDWTLHLHEEEVVFGRLVAGGLFSKSAYARILAEHRVIRRQLRLHGRVNPEFARRHARFEDAAVARMLRRP